MARITDQLMCNIIIIGAIDRLLLSLSRMASTNDEREDILNIVSYNSKGFQIIEWRSLKNCSLTTT